MVFVRLVISGGRMKRGEGGLKGVEVTLVVMVEREVVDRAVVFDEEKLEVVL